MRSKCSAYAGVVRTLSHRKIRCHPLLPVVLLNWALYETGCGCGYRGVASVRKMRAWRGRDASTATGRRSRRISAIEVQCVRKHCASEATGSANGEQSPANEGWA